MLLFIISAVNCHSQNIHIISATQQPWAGGICCRHGITYYIQLEIIQTGYPLQLDTLWLEGYCLDISKYNIKKPKKNDTLYVSIIENIVINDRELLNENGCYDPTKTGVSFSYYVNRRKKMMDISPDMKILEFIGYP